MDKYLTMNDFSGNGVIAILSAIVSAVPQFFSVLLFVLWLALSGASYFTILKTTGKKRFWHVLTSMSFVMVLSSLLIATMNTTEITFISGYWVGFYILTTLLSWYGLANYK